jgi:sterol desaturase/sphingolipid hydroxylase (fatty acid hydroxylase superfamily)
LPITGVRALLPSVALLVALAVVLFLIERVAPLRRRKAALSSRIRVNLAVSALAMATAGLAIRPVSLGLLGWTTAERFGLLRSFALPPMLVWPLCFVLLDLSFYYWHRVNHRLPLLWRFHNVHHVDPDLDVSTALRFHFGEVAFSAAFRALQVLLIGPPAAAYLAYELAFQANTLFHHSNVRLPLGIERRLSWLLVTPRMHGIHHSQFQGETDSNYSVVFPWWDWLHRSLRLGIPQSAVTVGVPGYARAQDNRLASLLLSPFRRQRDYWGDRRRAARSGEYGAGEATMLD